MIKINVSNDYILIYSITNSPNNLLLQSINCTEPNSYKTSMICKRCNENLNK